MKSTDVDDPEIRAIGRMIEAVAEARGGNLTAAAWRRLGDYAFSLIAQAEREVREAVPKPEPLPASEPRREMTPEERRATTGWRLEHRHRRWHVLG